MEAPDYCFAFNFLPANSASTAGALRCSARPAGASPERGQHPQPPHTHTHPPHTASRQHRRAAVGISKGSPWAAGASAGAGGACGRRGPAFWLQRGGARGLPAHGLPWGSAPPRADGPSPTSKPNNPRGKSVPTASREPETRKGATAPVEAGEPATVFLPARLRE